MFAATFLMCALIAFGPFVSATLAAATANDPICIEEMRRFGQIADGSNDKSILGLKARDEMKQAHRQLVELAMVDGKAVKDGIAAISESTIKASNALVGGLHDQLAALGFSVSIEKRTLVGHTVGGVALAIPERDILVIRAGRAKGKFARELRRYERDIASRLRDPNLLEEVRRLHFDASVDPLYSIATGSGGHFVSAAAGQGMGLSQILFYSDEEIAVEIIRHELRHAKSYFDLLSGKATVNRSSIRSSGFTGVDPHGNYANFFAIDEIDGFTSNVRTAQAALGKLTEKMRKIMASNERPSPSEIEAFKRDVEKLKAKGKFDSNRVSQMNNSILEYATRARARLADPDMTPALFSTQIDRVKSPYFPGHTRIVFKYGSIPQSTDEQLLVWVPNEVVNNGAESIRKYFIEHCNELEKKAIEVEKKNQERLADISRDAMSRLENVKSLKVIEPATE